MIEVECKVTVYEKDGQELAPRDQIKALVCSHSIRNELVELAISGARYTFNASDLQRAINNATNSRGLI